MKGDRDEQVATKATPRTTSGNTSPTDHVHQPDRPHLGALNASHRAPTSRATRSMTPTSPGPHLYRVGDTGRAVSDLGVATAGDDGVEPEQRPTDDHDDQSSPEA